MIEIVSAIFGFAAPFLPELMKIFTRKQDNAHEILMLKLQTEKGSQEHLWRASEIELSADAAQTTMLYQQNSSFGVQILDAAKGHQLGNWALMPAFYLFAFLDFMAGMVRPVITYSAFAFYAAVKWAQLTVALQANVVTVALINVWDDSDKAIVILVLSYWFGHRAAKAAFGGSASTATRGS